MVKYNLYTNINIVFYNNKNIIMYDTDGTDYVISFLIYYLRGPSIISCVCRILNFHYSTAAYWIQKYSVATKLVLKYFSGSHNSRLTNKPVIERCVVRRSRESSVTNILCSRS